MPFVVGHSLGGYVALSIANQAQEKISGLCLFHSTPYPDSDERKSNRNKVIDFVRKYGVDPFVDTFVPGLFYNKDHPAMPGVFAMARKTQIETLLAYTSAMRDRPSSAEDLKKTKKPVLTIAGENDSLISLESALEFGSFAPHRAIHILKSAGHMGMLEEPEKASGILSDFISTMDRD
jgi:pimeloyl-ACP methyl ester carboxylesterase